MPCHSNKNNLKKWHSIVIGSLQYSILQLASFFQFKEDDVNELQRTRANNIEYYIFCPLTFNFCHMILWGRVTKPVN